MNKKIVLGALAFIIIMPTSFAFATEEVPETVPVTGPLKRTEMRENIKAQRDEIQARRMEGREKIQASREEMRLEFQDKKEKMTEERCKNIENKVSTRINRYENNQSMTTKVYSRMQERLARLVTKLETAGADTAKLKTDIQTLNEKINKLNTDQTAFLITLKDSQVSACGKSEGEFKGKLDQARKIPESLKNDREDIKKFFQETIKADLQAIRATLADEKEAISPAPSATTPTATE